MKKKIVSVLLASLMVTSMLAGCGNSSGSSSSSGAGSTGGDTTSASGTEAGDTGLTAEEQEAVDEGIIQLDGTLPIIKDPAKFEEKYGKISALIVNTADRTVEVGDLAMCQKWFEDTGVEFDWQPIPQESATEKINLKAFLDDNEQYQLEITAPDGHKYGFPYVEEMKGLVLTPGPFVINKTWLDKVGKEVPTTVDEWVDCLKAIRDGGDLNGNGEDDEIPMATWFGATDTFGSYNLFYRFTGAFGCADSYCGGNSYADHLRIVDGKVTFTATDEAFKKTAEFFNMLYEEGLIWNGSFEADESMSFKSSLIKENVAKIGSFGVWGDQEITNQEVHDQYVAVPRLQGEDGMTGFECNYSELQDSSDTAITTTCKFPHVVARFVDYMVGDPEISVTSNWGAIGYNYEKDEDGILRTPLDENGNYKPLNPEYKNFGEARVNSTTCRGSMIVQNEYYDTVCGYTFDAVKLLEMQKENGKDDIMEEYDTIPRVLMTQEEIQRLAQIQPTISDIVDRYITTWVTGGVDDASWDSYKTELEGAGLNELVKTYQGAVDRAASAAN